MYILSLKQSNFKITQYPATITYITNYESRNVNSLKQQLLITMILAAWNDQRSYTVRILPNAPTLLLLKLQP